MGGQVTKIEESQPVEQLIVEDPSIEETITVEEPPTISPDVFATEPRTPAPVSIYKEKEDAGTTEELRFCNKLIDFRINKNHFKDGEEVIITYTHYHNVGRYEEYPGCYYDKFDKEIVDPTEAWFGIFPASAGLGEWSIWKYVSFEEQMVEQRISLEIKAEGQVGPWEVRFYADGNNENIVGRLPFFVEGDEYDPISIELDKTNVKEGETINVKFTVDPRVNATVNARIVYYTKGSPSIYGSCGWLNLNQYNGSIPVHIQPLGAHGWHEMRCFTSHASYTPCIRVPFYVNAPNPDVVNCYPRNVKDGSVMVVEWKVKEHESRYLCFYPEDDLVEENGFQFPLTGPTGSAKIRIESGQKQTGKWAVRVLNNIMMVMAATSFTLIGAKEAFAAKMLENIKFMDIQINFST